MSTLLPDQVILHLHRNIRIQTLTGFHHVDAVFFMLGWDWFEFDKSHAGTRYAELVFLHLVGTVGHIVHSGASEARNGDALFFMIHQNRYGLDKKTRRVKLCRIGVRIWSDL
jgi:hypothetical protein